jgi:ABC-type dipeptide/oligopeptide/nickel transport system permease subunit
MSFWGKFIAEFCKVQFLCYNWSPNWLGWMAIALIGIIGFLLTFGILGIFIGVIGSFFGETYDEMLNRLREEDKREKEMVKKARAKLGYIDTDKSA